jgi:hypothetical protein
MLAMTTVGLNDLHWSCRHRCATVDKDGKLIRDDVQKECKLPASNPASAAPPASAASAKTVRCCLLHLCFQYLVPFCLQVQKMFVAPAQSIQDVVPGILDGGPLNMHAEGPGDVKSSMFSAAKEGAGAAEPEAH